MESRPCTNFRGRHAKKFTGHSQDPLVCRYDSVQQRSESKVDGVKFGMHRQGPLMDHEVGVSVVFGGDFWKRLELLMAEIRLTS